MRRRTTAKSLMKRSVMDQEEPSDMSGNGKRDLIAMKAYEMYEQRGRIDGHDLDDWLKAEAIVKGTGERNVHMTNPMRSHA